MSEHDTESSTGRQEQGENTVPEPTFGKQGNISLQYPILNNTNYSAWAIKMEVYMEAQGVWEAVVSEEPIGTRKDKMALAAIYQGISEDTLMQLGAKKTVKEAWNALKTMHLGASRVKEVRAQALRWELESMRMEDNDTIDEFTGKIVITVNRLRGLGEQVEESYVVKKILRAVSPKFLQIALTMEEFGDVANKSIEEVTGSLKAHEERLKGYEEKKDDHVLLVRDDMNRTNSSRRFGVPRGRGGWRSNSFRGRGRFFDQRDRRGSNLNNQRGSFDITRIKCYACNEFGHFASECRKKEMIMRTIN